MIRYILNTLKCYVRQLTIKINNNTIEHNVRQFIKQIQLLYNERQLTI